MRTLDIQDLPGVSSLIRDYHADFSRLAPFYAWNPRDPAAWSAQADRCLGRTYPRAPLCAALLRQNLAWGAPPAVTERIGALAAPGALAVLTGQQTTLFGGPLYTLYKALTVVAVAARQEQELGRPVVPVFWMASEDHDIAEADHVHLLDRAGLVQSVRHQAWAEPRGAIPATLRLGPAIHETLERVWEFLPPSEFLDDLRLALAAAYRPERTLADAFARWLMHLLGATGLILADATDPALKRLAAPVFARELDEAPWSAQAILTVSQALRRHGYPVQIEARPDAVNCFLLRDGRRALVRDSGGIAIRDTGERLAPETWRTLLDAEPEALSPNVALRPIVQDTLFPTLAYVGGPGELTYFAQLKPLYDRFDVPMPLLLPRATLTLLEPRIAQLMARFHLRLADLVLEPEQLASRLLRDQLPPDVAAAVAQARADVDLALRPVKDALARVDPTLLATVGQAAGHIKGHLEQLERKAVQAVKRREAEMRQQLQRTREALMPGGRPQERVFPALPFLAKYGPGVLAQIRAAIDGPGWQHLILTLGTESA
jgi:bacillithiol biosynthesis cysteine-adding enzyme BshC